MIKMSDLREKEIINMNDGSRVGIISDMEIDIENGLVKAIIVPGQGKFLSLFSKGEEFVIDWNRIKKIGTDVILIDFDNIKTTE